MYQFVKFFLFFFPAERAHHLSTLGWSTLLKIPLISFFLKRLFHFEHPGLVTELMGLRFKNPIGLAAGFDKDARYVEAMAALGFGFIEIGTVTPKPQRGNPKPRLFRLIKDKAIINRMGFNNDGVDLMVERLARLAHRTCIIGGNIGKNKDTPNEEAHMDYLICLQKLYDYVDYFVVNISSPNTPGLRSLQEKEPLQKLLKVLTDERQKREIYRPILLKIAPDLSPEALEDVIDIVERSGIEGVIACNTTISRENLTSTSKEIKTIGPGGLSGLPVRALSDAKLDVLKKKLSNPMVLIGVGGIDNEEAAIDKFRRGASLIQIYTGLIYQGPFLVKRLKRAIVNFRRL